MRMGSFRQFANCSKILIGHCSSGTTHLKNHFTSCLGKNFKDISQMILTKKNMVDLLQLKVVLK